ncbi:MAG: hypothetical protein ACOYMF_11125 [Bacteroidales bacterium]
MDNLAFKKKLLEHCIQLKLANAENISAAMDEAQQSANEYGSPKDRYDSFRAQMLAKHDMFAQQLQTVKSELLLLQRIDGTRFVDIVGFGALVFLDDQIVFVSVGLGKVEFEGSTCYAVSLNVPLCKAMNGLKKGDSFDFRGKKMEILDIC